MAPTLLFDLSRVDFSKVQFDASAIEAVNPHRGDMRLLDGVYWISDDLNEAVAYKDVRDDEFWVPGHIPGRPIFPGVLMIEAAAQLASFLTLKRMPNLAFMGFAGVDDVKFRGMVTPGDRLVLIGHSLEFRPRRCICAAQALLNGTIVFEATITGMPM
ncbi:MAG: 3-hydroxyacyl-ACP dehydratase FabZ family protein [Phycisphaeraceae bacterium]